MGTNFYKLSKTRNQDNMDPKYHIGKRSAAGWYCWDCSITLCKDGPSKIHYSEYDWYDKCPNCGKKPIKENLDEGAVGRELGFNKSEFKRKTGVKSCCSFSWAMPLDGLKKCKFVKDEYGRKYTIEEFRKMILEECPIIYTNIIGEWFS